jgi:hypothetical protein
MGKRFGVYPNTEQSAGGIIQLAFQSCAALEINKTKLRGFGPRPNYNDQATAAFGEVLPTFTDRGCRVVGATYSHCR